MEAAVAYYQATGKDKLLHVMERMADHIISRFGEGKERGKNPNYFYEEKQKKRMDPLWSVWNGSARYKVCTGV